jgi:hypothetical protein
MEDKIQYFDSVQLEFVNGENHLMLTDNIKKTDTPVRVSSVNFGGSDFQKWFVTVASDSVSTFQYRNKFDTQKAATAYVKEVMLLVNKAGLQRAS